MSSSRCHPSFHESEKLINIQTFIFLVDFYVLTAVHRSRVPYYHSICIHVYAMSLLLNLVVYGALANSHITRYLYCRFFISTLPKVFIIIFSVCSSCEISRRYKQTFIFYTACFIKILRIYTGE